MDVPVFRKLTRLPRVAQTPSALAKPRRSPWFWTHVEQATPDECWPWQGRRDRHGYGVAPSGSPERSAHRTAYRLVHGPIPDGLQVRHRCDNPPCCNPEHLLLGSQADNMADRSQRGRVAAGARNGRAKATPDLVRALRAGKLSIAEYCEAAGVDRSTAYQTRKGRIWPESELQ